VSRLCAFALAAVVAAGLAAASGTAAQGPIVIEVTISQTGTPAHSARR
jgi:hypothetical protein